MRIRNLVFMLSFMLTSCYSYQKVPDASSAFSIGDRLKLVTTRDEFKGKLVAMDYDTLAVKMKNGKTLRITQNEVIAIKRAKFSVLKTIAIPGGVLLVAYALFQINDGPNFNAETGL